MGVGVCVCVCLSVDVCGCVSVVGGLFVCGLCSCLGFPCTNLLNFLSFGCRSLWPYGSGHLVASASTMATAQTASQCSSRIILVLNRVSMATMACLHGLQPGGQSFPGTGRTSSEAADAARRWSSMTAIHTAASNNCTTFRPCKSSTGAGYIHKQQRQGFGAVDTGETHRTAVEGIGRTLPA